MAIVLDWVVTARFQPDGAGGMSVPSGQAQEQSTKFGGNSGSILIAGGNTPTAAQIKTACTTAGTNAGTALGSTANTAVINGWGSGSN
jgi:hypothetical protein